MEIKQCFNCKEHLPLEDYHLDRRKYQVPADKGKCKVCIKCELKRALKNMEIMVFSLEENDFVTTKFKDSFEVINYFKKREEDERKIN